MDVIRTTIGVTVCIVGYVLFMCVIGFVFGKAGELLKPKKGDNRMASIKKFERELLEEIKKSGHTACIEEVLKQGDVKRRGIVIDKGENIVSPVCYVDDLYDLHKTGMTYEQIVKSMLDIKTPNTVKSHLDVDLFKHLTYRLLNIKNNEKLLETTPHYTICDDIALCLEAQVGEDEKGAYVSLITDKAFHSAMWECAEKTAPELSPAVMHAMYRDENILITGNVGFEPMYVLTTDNGLHGASVLFYDGVKERIYDILGEYYALPSSIHEWIIVPVKDGDETEVEAMKEMVVDANKTVVAFEDVLSDNPYIYDGKELRIA